ncbi:glioma pathogenesis-related protein 1-like [Pterocles gutturalis]
MGGGPSGEAPAAGAMRPWVAVLALWPVLRAAARLSPALPSITDKTFKQDCVHHHNNLRAGVGPPASNMRYMTWDAALARTARAWANKCIFEHNIYLNEKHQCHPNFTSIGENIWVGSHQAFSVAGVIKSWYDEVKSYTFAEEKCTAVCGHYTQVVWDDSYKVGCAVTLYYSRWHPPWEFRIACNVACITVIVLRALLMFLAFVAVYFIQKHFTNIHMST